MEHAAPAGSVFRASKSSNASSGLPGPPAGGRGNDGRIHDDQLRHSTAAQREVASLCLYICCHHFLYISILCWRALGRSIAPSVVVVLHNKNPPTPCLWQAPASTQKTKRKTRPAIRRSARWRVTIARSVHFAWAFRLLELRPRPGRQRKRQALCPGPVPVALATGRCV